MIEPSHATVLRAEIVAWAKRWRSEKCSRLIECCAYDGSHDADCEIRKNEIDGVALLDALALAEKDEATSG